MSGGPAVAPDGWVLRACGSPPVVGTVPRLVSLGVQAADGAGEVAGLGPVGGFVATGYELTQHPTRELLPALARTTVQRHTESHGREVPSIRTDGDAVAVCCHDDTPRKTSKPLISKLKG